MFVTNLELSGINSRIALSGEIYLETLVDEEKLYGMNLLGGPLIYSTAGFLVWGLKANLISETSIEMPDEYLDILEQVGMNTEGICRLHQFTTIKRFIEIGGEVDNMVANKAEWFARHGLKIPQVLRDRMQSTLVSGFTALPANSDDISARYFPDSFDKCEFVLLNITNPQNYLKMTAFFTKKKVSIVSFDAAFFQNTEKNALPLFLQGEQIVILHHCDLHIFKKYNPKLNQPKDVIAYLQSFGCKNMCLIDSNQIIITEHKANSQMILPRYPVKRINRLYEKSVFAGGLLAGLACGNVITESAIMGIVSMSLTNQFLPFELKPDVLPELLHARMEWVRSRSDQDIYLNID